MFYVKAEISEGVTLKVEITNENIFINCPACGVEHHVPLKHSMGDDGVIDLHLRGHDAYCTNCSEPVKEEWRQGEGNHHASGN